MSDSPIEIVGLRREFGSFVAVDNLDLSIKKNSFTGFLGPNGAGKSTALNILTGYLSATSGEAYVDGIDIFENPVEAKKSIGFLPEQPPLYPEMKVLEYLNFVYDLKGCKLPRKQHLSEICGVVQLTDVTGRLIKNLSKGYRQRVGFAQALIGDPQVLILDEPTVGLDPNQTMEVRNLINMLRKDHTIIFSSHILQEVSAVCDRIVIIDKGQIKAVDTKENLTGAAEGDIVYILKVEGECKSVEAVLKKISGIKNIMEVNYVDEKTSEFKIELEAEDVRKEIISEMLENDMSIIEIKKMTMSLEDVFASYTRGRSYSGLATEETDDDKK